MGFTISSDKIVEVSLRTDFYGTENGVEIPVDKNRGCYQFMVESDEEHGANGIWMCSSSSNGECGIVNRMAHSIGANSESLNIGWPAHSNPRLYYTTPQGKDGFQTYRVKIISVK